MKHYFFKLIYSYKTEGFLKTIERILDYARWRNPIRVMVIREIQRRRLIKDYCPTARRLIIFLTPGHNWINGGILSINSIYNETRKLKEIHGAEVVMCTDPGGNLLLGYTKFENQNYLYSFPDVLSYFQSLDSLLIHIPELSVEGFAENYSVQARRGPKKIKYLHINILLQNIEKVPSREAIKKLEILGTVTCTTAHEAYSTPETEERLGCPVHKLSTFGSPEQYLRNGYSEKERLMVISPDEHELRSVVLSSIKKAFPRLRLQVIKNLSYEEYKRVISKAKWAITFGEGLDGYFIEPIFSGAIAFAVYNDKFFTKDFKTLRTVYPDYETLNQNICMDIAALDNESTYTQYQRKQFESCAKHYDYKLYQDNVASFYNKYYPMESPLQESRTS